MTRQNYLGFVIWIASLALLLIFIGSRIAALINIPALLWVGLGVAGALQLTRNPQQSRRDRLKVAAQAAWHAGIIGFAIGAICLLASLNDPQQIGPNLSVALTSILYGSIVSVVCFSLSQHPEPAAE